MSSSTPSGVVVPSGDVASLPLSEEVSEEVSEALGAPLEDIERNLKVIQGFDPPGVGARNLQIRRHDPVLNIILECLNGRYVRFESVQW